jgi:hypothetical protein
MLDVEINWQDLPPRRKGQLDPRWDEMKRYPGKWCLWGIGMKMSPILLVSRHPGFHAVSRNTRMDEDSKRIWDIYVRFIGESDGAGIVKNGDE